MAVSNEDAATADAAAAGSTGAGARRSRPGVRLVEVSKRYGSVAAVTAANLEVGRGELFTLLGASGSGKTTILRMIAGLIAPTEGEIWIEDEEIHARPTHARNIGLVFQSLALFPHMDVFANVAFPLRMRRTGRTEIRRRVAEALEKVHLPDIQSRKPEQLSGGQQQRVALARALVYNPDLLLLDEPFGALDRRLREDMQLEIVRLHNDLDVTIINVTHDQREALIMSDRIGVMRAGFVEQVGTSDEMYRHPATRYVAEFIGDATLLDGAIPADDPTRFDAASGAAVLVDGSTAPGPATLVVRSEVVDLAADRPSDPRRNAFDGTVALGVFEGATMYYEVDVPALGVRLKATVPASQSRALAAVGSPVRVGWHADDAFVVPR